MLMCVVLWCCVFCWSLCWLSCCSWGWFDEVLVVVVVVVVGWWVGLWCCMGLG